MNPLNWLKRAQRKQRRKKALKSAKLTLREFAYLDDVSLYSLTASRLGSIATEFTMSEQLSLQGEASAGVSADTIFAKGETRFRALTASQNSSQVLRKAVIQSTFGEFYKAISDGDSLRLKSSPITQEVSSISSLTELEAALPELLKDRSAVLLDTLSRGDLFEVEVALETEDIYRISEFISLAKRMVNDSPELFPQINNFAEIIAAGNIIDELLVGLIPIKGEILNYRQVVTSRGEVLIRSELLKEVIEFETHPLYIVGVTEQQHYWKDVRRVLFSGAKYRVLGRVARPDIQNSWTPLKAIDLLDQVLPGMTTEIKNIPEMLLTQMRAGALDSGKEAERLALTKAMTVYAKSVAETFKITLTQEDKECLETITSKVLGESMDAAGRRKAFDRIQTYFKAKHELDPKPEVLVGLRENARKEAGIAWDGIVPKKLPKFMSRLDESKNVLEVEVVATYW